MDTRNLYISLIHHPVVNKKGDVISSAITNLDLHDIARAARTFGVAGYYVVCPLEDQIILAEKIVQHWTCGHGGELNPARREAFGLIRIRRTLDEVIDELCYASGQPPTLVATSAREDHRTVRFSEMKNKLEQQDGDVLLLFGTAWGLSGEVMDRVDAVLEPVRGFGGYNHLSVRSAVSIILDRLTVRPDGNENL